MNNCLYSLQNRWLIGMVKLLLSAGCFFFILNKLSNQSFDFQQIHLPIGFTPTLTVVIVLMIINWYLEALRWKMSLETFEVITLKKAWMTILGGQALNWIFPFTSGDFITRVFRQRDKYRTASVAILNRGVMLGFTLIVGFNSIPYLIDTQIFNNWIIVTIVLSISLIFIFFKKRVIFFFSHYLALGKKILTKVFLLSLLRYLTFTIQFYLLLRVFFPVIDTEILVAGIGWIFLVRSVFPLFLGGVGVREASGILFFEPYVNEVQLVVFPIFLIWVINIVIPSFFGLIFVWRFKFNIA